MSSPFDTIYVERNGKVWPMHFRNRHDPITLGILAITATGIGTAVGVSQKLQEGKDAEKLAERRAQIDIENAEATRKASVEDAKIKEEKGRKLRATQTSTAAASNIRINAGVPLVIKTETRAAVTKDIGFGLERGRAQSDFYRSRAALEIAGGKLAKKKSKLQALQLGLQGAASMAFMGANLPSKPPGALPSGLPQVGTFKPEVGATLARY